MTFRPFVAIFAVCAALTAGPAIGADRFAPHDPHHRLVETPHCTDAKVTAEVLAGFRHKARNELHRPDLAIVDIVHIHQNRFEPQDAYADTFTVPRRYCEGRALLNNGDHRTVWYLIEGGAGFATIGANVEFCVSGFDRWNVHNSHCRVLR